ncbi:hypothetical protein EU99_0145 [Prochlorococcus marinus str. MIT 9321]|uniref:Uncharacterized protein n=1 Tax=Prochlorococcus marinus str. MIT 9401 TaxID=167551 RepID=A0A0A2B0V4_PROMR|nr:hypothetical protein EU99_0145 [Prochlorococcus marinus str. MIT 9321]KGG06209.1 hypothetical protein EV00_0510 [Prochlorococcus marinus str. MIT 9322]KGG06782.1 hypothetical protein EV01_1988 [Prochlorococcus marinus str. MIT 9401]
MINALDKFLIIPPEDLIHFKKYENSPEKVICFIYKPLFCQKNVLPMYNLKK